jgi:hypothetical protein
MTGENDFFTRSQERPDADWMSMIAKSGYRFPAGAKPRHGLVILA